MSDTTPTDLPSRRQLRESGMTGPIDIQTAPPLTRRERKMREQMEATGAIPVMSASAPVIDSPVTSEPEPPQPVAPPAPEPVASTPVAPVIPPAPSAEPTARPLTRRELREQLRGKAKDVPPAPVPVVGLGPEDDTPAVIAPKPTPRVVEEEFSWQKPLEEPGEMEPPQLQVKVVAPAQPETPAPLPPVFGTIPSGRDTPTAPARSVSTAAPATNALILPVAPSIDVTGPLGDTGEVLVTGNIPLPRMVAETGVTGVLDVDDDDDFMEADSGPYTAPISASLAVSSRSLELDQPMIQKPRVGAVSLALAVSAAILGVTAVSLLALALLTDIIQLPF
jgi:hypothetical protein